MLKNKKHHLKEVPLEGSTDSNVRITIQEDLYAWTLYWDVSAPQMSILEQVSRLQKNILHEHLLHHYGSYETTTATHQVIWSFRDSLHLLEIGDLPIYDLKRVKITYCRGNFCRVESCPEMFGNKMYHNIILNS